MKLNNTVNIMKKYISLFFFLLTLATYSQTGITYQAVILNPQGEELPGVDNNRSPLANQTICLRFKIYNNANQLEYQETIVTTTDEFGMVNVVIGTGTYTGGTATTISAVTWDGTPKNLVVEVDTTGTCSNFTQISNQPFTYVPYAFYAANSGSSTTPGPQGPPGPAGPQGPIGLTGTTGPQGIQGPIGLTGAAGPAGPQGLQGIQGATGAQGPQGVAGSNGTGGTQGPAGTNGLSAYQVAVANGYSGTEAQWLASLVGATGPQGNAGANGTNGVDGKNTIINTTTEPAGATCANGGVKMEFGLDSNSNGVLDADEINNSLTKYVCNGANAGSAGIFTHYIGELYGGGIIAALWISGGVEHGLIVSLTELGTGLMNGAPPISNYVNVPEAKSWSDGQYNTNIFLSAYPGATTVQSAEYICSQYNGGGYNDWYLPAIDELVQIFNVKYILNKVIANDIDQIHPTGFSEINSIGFFGSQEYISSTINNKMNFGNGTINVLSNSFGQGRVRAVRKF